MSRTTRNDAVPLSGKLKAIAADMQRVEAAQQQSPEPRPEPKKTGSTGKKRSVANMSKARQKPVRGAGAARDRMISRHDGGTGAPGGSAEASRARMIERGAGRNEPQSAEAARAAMLARHDGAEHESQQYVADMMRSNTGKAWEKIAQGNSPDEELVAACFRDLYDEGAMEPHQTATPSADEARARMLDRMSGACPDRLPSDYKPLPGNDR